MKLVIQESRWAAAGLNNGASALVNSQGCMCCLGFLGAACTKDPTLLQGNYVPFRHPDIDWPEQVLIDTPADGPASWSGEAMGINDRSMYSLKDRKERLIEHFKKINIELEFVP